VVGASIVLGIVIRYSALPAYIELGSPGLEFLYFDNHYFERLRQAEVDKLRLAVVAAEASCTA
jgi:hypothetical protein